MKQGGKRGGVTLEVGSRKKRGGERKQEKRQEERLGSLSKGLFLYFFISFLFSNYLLLFLPFFLFFLFLVSL